MRAILVAMLALVAQAIVAPSLTDATFSSSIENGEVITIRNTFNALR
jgi:hypothetical protein